MNFPLINAPRCDIQRVGYASGSQAAGSALGTSLSFDLSSVSVLANDLAIVKIRMFSGDSVYSGTGDFSGFTLNGQTPKQHILPSGGIEGVDFLYATHLTNGQTSLVWNFNSRNYSSFPYMCYTIAVFRNAEYSSHLTNTSLSTASSGPSVNVSPGDFLYTLNSTDFNYDYVASSSYPPPRPFRFGHIERGYTSDDHQHTIVSCEYPVRTPVDGLDEDFFVAASSSAEAYVNSNVLLSPKPESGTSATFYDVNDYYFRVIAIDPGVYEIEVMWNGSIVVSTTVNDTTLPTSVTTGGIGTTYYRSGSNQGDNKFAVYRVVP